MGSTSSRGRVCDLTLDLLPCSLSPPLTTPPRLWYYACSWLTPGGLTPRSMSRVPPGLFAYTSPLRCNPRPVLSFPLKVAIAAPEPTWRARMAYFTRTCPVWCCYPSGHSVCRRSGGGAL